MVYQKLNYNKLTKIWFFAFYKKYIKKGQLLQSYNLFLNIWKKLLCLLKKININDFFLQIYKNLYCPVSIKKYVKSGKILKMPMRVTKTKEIFFYVSLIYNSIKQTASNTFEDILIAELFQIYNNVGPVVKKQNEFRKLVFESLPNRKLLEKKN